MHLIPQSTSVGIIGGADGPTAVFVSSPVPLWVIAAGIAAVALLITGVVLYIKRK